MKLDLRSFNEIVSDGIRAMQSQCTALMDCSVGTAARALIESVSFTSLWLQTQCLNILSATRASTSIGEDLDSFVGDFGFTRLPGNPATGIINFVCYSPQDNSSVIPVGALVRRSDGVTYEVTQDRSNPAWSDSSAGYVRQAGITAIGVPVKAQVGGADGNCATGAINLLGSQIANINTCTNPAPFVNGEDAESDAQLRARFQLFFEGRNTCTLAAIQAAAQSVQAGLVVEVQENIDAAGFSYPGNVVVWVDDGTGSPPDSLIASVYAACDVVRAAGVSIQVVAFKGTTVNVSMKLLLAPGTDPYSTHNIVDAAIASYVDKLNGGVALDPGLLLGIIFRSSTDIIGVDNLLLNGQSGAITPANGTVLRLGTVTYE